MTLEGTILDGDGCVVEAKNLCQKEKDCLIKQKQSFSIMCANYKFLSNFHMISCLGTDYIVNFFYVFTLV